MVGVTGYVLGPAQGWGTGLDPWQAHYLYRRKGSGAANKFAGLILREQGPLNGMARTHRNSSLRLDPGVFKIGGCGPGMVGLQGGRGWAPGAS